MKDKTILFITTRFPFPAVSGRKTSLYHYCRIMKKLGYKLIVASFFDNFSIKDKEAAKKEVMAEAYTKAKDKAEIIALAAGKTLKDCVKVDFRPFETAIQSRSSLSDNDFSAMCLKETSAFGVQKSSAKDVIQTIFTPEDVEIRETLYCLWITE